jgi:porphobilinogen synthase
VNAFPATRLRRLRGSEALRSLVRETRLGPEGLVQPLFVAPAAQPNERLPALARHTVEGLLGECEQLLAARIGAVMLFGIPEAKDELGSGAYAPDGIVQQAVAAIKARFPELAVLTDVCLCEYTSHGHCGVLRGAEVDNDASVELLVRVAVSHAEAGADAVCPSDMMDGRVGAIRAALPQTPIVAYAAKYASAFYGPFREAAGSVPSLGDRRGYQMDPANAREALAECELDIAEGADVLMIKPALAYLDVIAAARARFDLPIAAYNVSGEYAMIKAAAAAGDLDEVAGARETLTAIRRAGAGIIVSYWGKELAQWL